MNRGLIVNSLNALANEKFNCEEKIRLTVSELRRKLGKLLNGHLENILRKMVAAAIIERKTFWMKQKGGQSLMLEKDSSALVSQMLDLLCLVFC